MSSNVADPSLAPEGARKIAWVEQHMPVLAAIEEELAASGDLDGVPLAICLHLEAKTARLALALHRAGAQVAITGSNPLSTQDDVAAALADEGVSVHSWYGMSQEEYGRNLDTVLAHGPVAFVDDGADLVARLHEHREDLIPEVRGAAEETTTGVIRLQALARDGRLRIPAVAVNDARAKHLFDNRHGTGQSVWDGVMRSTNLNIAGKTVCVVGYGWCGKGIAARGRGLGARVIVCEVEAMTAVEAFMEGYEVMSAVEAAREADIFVTATGVRDVLRREHFEVMRDGAILCNAGHFDVEVSLSDLDAVSTERVTARRNVTTYTTGDGRDLHLIAEGALVNLAAADGHPAEIMDLTFALQALSVAGFVRGDLPDEPGVHPVPREIDDRVAELFLSTGGITIDELSPEQERYRASWEVGWAR